MAEYSSAECSEILSAFQILNDNDIRYVVCRGHQDLPQSVPGADIDLLVHHDDFKQTKKILQSEGFSTPKKTIWINIRRYLNIALKKPKDAIRKVMTEPSDLLRMLTDTGTGADSLRGTYKESKFHKHNVKFHFFNHLAYKSPMNNKPVRVNPEVGNKMIERRLCNSEIFVPSPPDELAHLICRGVFDKDGYFPDYYIDRCSELESRISNNKTYQKELNDLLNLIFFDADIIVKKAIDNGEYDSLQTNLRTYSNY